VFLDLEDAVAPSAKVQARANAVAALMGDWGDRLVAVRVNDAATQWAHRDVLDVVSGGPLVTTASGSCTRRRSRRPTRRSRQMIDEASRKWPRRSRPGVTPPDSPPANPVKPENELQYMPINHQTEQLVRSGVKWKK
jgi:hypothetical protein